MNIYNNYVLKIIQLRYWSKAIKYEGEASGKNLDLGVRLYFS